jgi:hypothetical protein
VRVSVVVVVGAFFQLYPIGTDLPDDLEDITASVEKLLPDLDHAFLYLPVQG